MQVLIFTKTRTRCYPIALIILSILVIYFLTGCNSQNNKKVELEMAEQELTLTEKIKKIKLEEEEKLDLLSKEISDRSRKDIFELIKILHSSNKEDSKKAALILMSVGDLVLTPMLNSLDKNNPDSYAREMDFVFLQHYYNRNKISVVLNDMLLDKRELKLPELKGPVEELPKVRRVCDNAYLYLRKMFSFKEDEEMIMTNERLFLDMPMEDRDKEIKRLKSSKEWISLSEYFLDQGE